MDLLDGQYKSPIGILCFNPAEGRARDVSEDIARELRRRCDLQLRDVPSSIQDFVERHEGHHRQLALRLGAMKANQPGGALICLLPTVSPYKLNQTAQKQTYA
jgi:hypothetical protein